MEEHFLNFADLGFFNKQIYRWMRWDAEKRMAQTASRLNERLRRYKYFSERGYRNFEKKGSTLAPFLTQTNQYFIKYNYLVILDRILAIGPEKENIFGAALDFIQSFYWETLIFFFFRHFLAAPLPAKYLKTTILLILAKESEVKLRGEGNLDTVSSNKRSIFLFY